VKLLVCPGMDPKREAEAYLPEPRPVPPPRVSRRVEAEQQEAEVQSKRKAALDAHAAEMRLRNRVQGRRKCQRCGRSAMHLDAADCLRGMAADLASARKQIGRYKLLAANRGQAMKKKDIALDVAVARARDLDRRMVRMSREYANVAKQAADLRAETACLRQRIKDMEAAAKRNAQKVESMRDGLRRMAGEAAA
jgi:hypothetical protein